MNERKICPVIDNMDKRYTYAQHKGRYSQAMKYEFYFEALMIDYALMEDRLKSFLYHAGVLNSRTSHKIDCSKPNKALLKQIYCKYRNKTDVNLPKIQNISGKIDIIRAVLEWVSNTEQNPNDSRYLRTLKNQCESVDIGDMLNTLKMIEDWCKYRNEVVHALMNKNIDSLRSVLCDKAIEGMELANRLDTYVRDMKKGNKVRKSANMCIEK
ncbi:MAG: hypothetical protein E7556_03825 [Ruminococcaceae bacterium]|nr:hypothetical protein [Oscillospiraceae bacterium]